MSKRDDINKLYKPSELLEKVCKVLFCCDIGISLIAAILKDPFSFYLTVALIVIAFLYMVLSVLDDGVLWYKAESARRKNIIQDAFQVRLDEHVTEGYYNNSIRDPELSYIVNTFESAFFTKVLSEHMLWKSYAKIIISIAIVFVSCRLITDNVILLIVAQSAFSAFAIRDSVRLILFVQRIRELYDSAYHELITVGISKYEQRVWLKYFCIEYESIKAHYKIRLNRALFNKMNDSLSEDWEGLLQQIKIAEEDKND